MLLICLHLHNFILNKMHRYFTKLSTISVLRYFCCFWLCKSCPPGTTGCRGSWGKLCLRLFEQRGGDTIFNSAKATRKFMWPDCGKLFFTLGHKHFMIMFKSRLGLCPGCWVGLRVCCPWSACAAGGVLVVPGDRPVFGLPCLQEVRGCLLVCVACSRLSGWVCWDCSIPVLRWGPTSSRLAHTDAHLTSHTRTHALLKLCIR